MATYAVAEPADDGEESDPDAVYDFSSFNPAYFAEIIAEKQAALASGGEAAAIEEEEESKGPAQQSADAVMKDEASDTSLARPQFNAGEVCDCGCAG